MQQSVDRSKNAKGSLSRLLRNNIPDWQPIPCLSPTGARRNSLIYLCGEM
jgi:hypothetical protein